MGIKLNARFGNRFELSQNYYFKNLFLLSYSGYSSFMSGAPSGRSRRLPIIMRLAENERSEV
jgi:hypothetical protein